METYEDGRVREQQELLKSLVDSSSLAGVLENLSSVVRTNWQDEASARAWEFVARRIDKAAAAALERGI